MKTIIIAGFFLIAGISIATAQDAPKLNCTHIGKLTICTIN